MKKVKKTEYVCNMCGDKFYPEDELTNDYKGKQVINEKAQIAWIHGIKLASPGYGSFLDNADIEEIHLCDDCLENMFNSMAFKPKIT